MRKVQKATIKNIKNHYCNALQNIITIDKEYQAIIQEQLLYFPSAFCIINIIIIKEKKSIDSENKNKLIGCFIWNPIDNGFFLFIKH
jgi:hypothetical protein